MLQFRLKTAPNFTFQLFPLYKKINFKTRFSYYKHSKIQTNTNQQMGPRQSSQTRSREQQFFSSYEIIQQLPNENIRFLEHKQTKKEYLLRQLNLNDKKEYLKAIETAKSKKQQLKNADHITPIAEIFQKEEDQYCSTFYKLYVLFQYPQRTLDDEINQRNLRKNNFSETQLWSILASCILGLSHLQRKSIRHCSLKSSMIFLSQQGLIKLSDPYTTGCQSNYQTLLNKRSTRHIYLSPQQCQALQSQLISPPNINPYKSDIFTLGMIILQCGLLQYQDECYRDEYSRIHWETLEYNKNRFRKSYSEELGNMLDYMLGAEVNSRPEWIELENYVITDNMGKSFINQGRKSAIIGYSKPTSVNIANKLAGFDKSHAFVQRPISENKIIHKDVPIMTNKGIGISNSKPNSAMKFTYAPTSTFQTHRQQFTPTLNQFRPISNIYQGTEPLSNLKPKSVSTNIPPFVGNTYFQTSLPLSNLPSSISNLPNFSKPFIAESPIKSQALGKNYDIPPVSVSNISTTRPFRSIFPNPFYETKTKVDENLVQVDEQEQTSRSMSEASQYKNDSYGYSQGIQGSYSNVYNGNLSQPHPITSSPFHQNSVSNFTPQSYGYNGQALSQNVNSYNESQKITQQNSPSTINNQFSSNHVPLMKKFQGEYVIQTFKLGSRYEGYKLNGMRHGPGKFFYQDGGMYDGNWVRNKMEGYGKLYYQSGKIAYDGEWVQDQFTGHGILYNQNPDALSQPFQYKNFDNVEELWTKYQGSFSEDSKNGRGILYLSNGQYFEGNFLNDTTQGEGIYTTLNGTKVKGIWQNNLLVRQF